ncbi:glycoside hydrolase family 97 protein [Sandarakinorhabdus oryzae]|uniref:glycoside hydrolase family 97 protein n=1 Tax=Sandarakinorhabdus oryzae TaxID=2675220 RepID=UPI0012E0DE9C|nr:glycoside hydrolase family 97 protein [Sandarakinorhabdus oryzae]
MRLILALCALLLALPALAEPVVQSPDGRTRVSVTGDGDGRLYWQASRDGQPLLAPSPLGFILADAPKLDRKLAITGEAHSSSDMTWDQPWGERAKVRDRHNQLVLHIAETSVLQRKFDLVLRVSDDGIALRYSFPEQPNLKTLRIVAELTEFRIANAAGGRAWWIPALEWNREEYLYRATGITEVGLAQTPMTMQTTSGTWLSIHEAALVNYAGMNLQPAGNGIFRAALTPSSSGPPVVVAAPFVTPWRVVMIGDTAPALANSNLILNLNDPNKLGDVSWVHPCKYAGIWWGMHLDQQSWATGPKHGATTANAIKMIDWAAANGLCGLLIEGWNKGWDGDWFANGWDFRFAEPTPDFDMAAIAAYAKKKGIGLIGHHETSGNLANYEAQLDAGMAWYQQNGVTMVKTGYVADAGGLQVSAQTPGIDMNGQPRGLTYEWHEGQASARHHVKVLEVAAAHHISVNSHEPIKDTGLRRTYPNWVSREGARGMEFNAWGNPNNGPEHEATLAFTRLLAGPMDYTPGIVSLEGRGQKIPSTLAKQLALYVTIYSPLQMVADLPENYAKAPKAAMDFIRAVPVDWEESVTLAGEPGSHVVTARQRRGGQDWWLGAAGGKAAVRVDVPLAFLTPGKRYRLTLWRDGDSADANPHDLAVESRIVTSADHLAMRLAAGGGGAAGRFDLIK